MNAQGYAAAACIGAVGAAGVLRLLDRRQVFSKISKTQMPYLSSGYCCTLGSSHALSAHDAGNKAVVLHKLLPKLQRSAGALVPMGEVILTTAFEDHCKEILTNIREKWELTTDVNEISKGAVSIFERTSMNPDMESLLEALVQRLPTHRRYMVRSSAACEDGSASSFAGLFTSVPISSVDKESLKKAILQVWSSAFTPAVLAHLRSQDLSPDLLSMAVIVQDFVPADASGVAYSRDLHNRDCVGIEAGTGTCAVVEGSEKPTRYVVDRASREIQCIGNPNTHVLSAKDVQVLADAVLRVEDLQGGHPQDVEFAVANGQVFIVQSRPDVSWLWVPPGEGTWSLRSESSYFPDKRCTKLYLEAVIPGVEVGFRTFFDKYCGPDVTLREVHHFVYRRMCFNWANLWVQLRRLHAAIRGLQWEKDVDEWFAEVYPGWQETEKSLQSASWRSNEMKDQELVNCLQDSAHFLQHAAAGHRRFNGACALPLVELIIFLQRHIPGYSSEDERSVVQFVAAKGTKPSHSSLINVGSPLIIAVVKALTGSPLEPYVLEANIADAHEVFQRLCEGEPNNVSKSVSELMKTVGHWTTAADITSPTIQEKPQMLLAALKRGLKEAQNMEDGEYEAPTPVEDENVNAMPILTRLPPTRLQQGAALLRLALRANPIREDRFFAGHFPAVGLYRLFLLESGRRLSLHNPSGDDAMILDFGSCQEVCQALENPLKADKLFRAAQKTRQRRLVCLVPPEELPVGSVVVEEENRRPVVNIQSWMTWFCKVLGSVCDNPLSRGMEWYIVFSRLDSMSWTDQPTRPPVEKDNIPQPSNGDVRCVLQGISASPHVGTAEGHACNADAVQTYADPILILEEATIEHNLLFASIIGIVTEKGGIYSHAATMARECGIPCVTQVDCAVKKIRTGDYVRLNPSDGTVEVLNSLPRCD